MSAPGWPATVTLAEARRGMDLHVAPDADARAEIALLLDLEGLETLEADLTFRRWLDGAVFEGRWSAGIVQLCGVSLDAFPTTLGGAFRIRVVPAGSANAPGADGGEVVIDPEAEDPPDVLEDELIDVGAYLVEHLALEIDPFPRKPGVAFEAPAEPAAPSPFDALKRLKE